MGKDGAGGLGGSTTATPSGAKTIATSNPLLTIFAAMDRELARLHLDLERGNGDDDETQDQIRKLQENLIRLSNQL